MSFTVPRLPYPGGILTTSEARVGVRTDYRTDGSVSSVTSYTSGESRLTFGGRGDMSRNKPRILVPTGTLWKPCTNYSTGMSLCLASYGVMRNVSKSTGRVTRKYEGPPVNANQRATGPHVNAANCKPYDTSMNTLNRLKTEVMIKVGSKKASYGEALAESRQTVNHLAKTVRSLTQAVIAAKRGNWRGVAKALEVPVKRSHIGKSTSSRWLEYQYAWLPLMGDAFDTYELLKDGFRKEAQIASSVRVITDTVRINNDARSADRERESGVSVRKDFMKLYYRINDSDLSKLNQLGLINPLSIAWELVPYSFVVDWFLPVGSVFEALTARLGCTFIDGYRGISVESNIRVEPRWTDNAVEKTTSCSMSTRTLVKGFTRVKLNAWPIPALYMKNPFSTTHLLSAMALLRQLSR